LIHPSQITTANRCFTPDPQALQHATNVLAVEQAVKNHGVAVANGQLVEQLHIDEARRLLCLYELSTQTV